MTIRTGKKEELVVKLRNRAQYIAETTDDKIAFLQSGTDASANVMTDLIKVTAEIKADLIEVRDFTGMDAYLKDVEQDVNYDIVAEINAVITALDACVTEAKNILLNESGYAETETVDANGNVSTRVITAAEYNGLIQPLIDLRALVVEE